MTNVTAQGGYLPLVNGLENLADSTQPYAFRRNGGGLAAGVAAAASIPETTTEEGGGGGGGGSGAGGVPPEDTGDEASVTYTLGLTSFKANGNYAGDGGGIYSAAPLTALNVTASGNRGLANGGGLYNDAASTITNSTFSGNGAAGGGGMFDTGSHTTTLSGTEISGNVATGGGGISARSGVVMKIVNSTVSGNQAKDVGGGVYSNGKVDIVFSTIADNRSFSDATNGGSGISTFQSGSVGITLLNTLLARNMKGAADATLVLANCGYTGGTTLPVTSLGHNIETGNTCALAGTGDLSNVADPKVDTLKLNSPGFNQTHALLSGSPAINRAVPVAGVTTDQRGAARDDYPDVGSYDTLATGTATDIGTTSGSSSSCFIATAAFGSPMEEDVRYLRAFRDEFLLTSKPGRKFVEFYYRNSPPIADYIRGHDMLRAVVRGLLKPLIALSRGTVSEKALDATRR
jgi:hypothetical protein